MGNISCGDIMWFFIKVGKKKINGKEKEYIKDIKFKTLGCAAAIATTSVMTALAKGKTLEEAIKITNKDVIKSLGKLPKVKVHCSLLAEEGLSEAIYDYLRKNGRAIPKILEKRHKKIMISHKAFESKHGKNKLK